MVPASEWRAEVFDRQRSEGTPETRARAAIMSVAASLPAEDQREVARILRLGDGGKSPSERQADYQRATRELAHYLAPEATAGEAARAVLRCLTVHRGHHPRWVASACRCDPTHPVDRAAHALLLAWDQPDLPSWRSLKRWIS